VRHLSSRYLTYLTIPNPTYPLRSSPRRTIPIKVKRQLNVRDVQLVRHLTLRCPAVPVHFEPHLTSRCDTIPHLSVPEGETPAECHRRSASVSPFLALPYRAKPLPTIPIPTAPEAVR
jgi:hypothetical protein